MPLDPDIRTMLDRIAARPALTDLSIEARRAEAATVWGDIMRAGEPGIPGVVTRDSEIDAGDHQIPIRVYRPAAASGTLPVILYFHGGSWVIGSIDSHDLTTRRLAARADAVVISVEYRLAPEHPFPAGFDDAATALRWVFGAAATFGGDPTRITVSGDSAGGSFSAALAVVARDEHLPLAAQLLFYPSSDLSKRYPAMDEFASGYLLETPAVDFPDREYLVDPDLRFDPRVSPILTESFDGVAPAVVYTAEFDPIKEHGTALVDRYRQAGVRVIHHEAPGLIHGFLQAEHSPAAMAAVDRACADLVTLLHGEA